MILESKLVDRVIKRLDEEDAKAVETMSSGLFRDYAEYQHSAGYRRALRDAKTILTETLDDLMKE